MTQAIKKKYCNGCRLLTRIEIKTPIKNKTILKGNMNKVIPSPIKLAL